MVKEVSLISDDALNSAHKLAMIISGGMTEKKCTIFFNEKLTLETTIFSAVILSKRISQIFEKDPTTTVFHFNIPMLGTDEEKETLIRKLNDSLRKGKKLQLETDNEIVNICRIGKEILNYSFIKSLDSKEIKENNVLFLIDMKWTLIKEYSNIDKEIEFIAEQFESMSKNENFIQFAKKNENIGIIEKIIESDKLSIETEDTLLQFLISICSSDDLYLSLFEYVLLDYCSPEECEKFIRFLKGIFQNHSIISLINCFSKRVCKSVIADSAKKENRHNSTIPSKMSIKELDTNRDGIIHSLKKYYGNDIIDKGIIAVSTSRGFRSYDRYYGQYNGKNVKYLLEYDSQLGYYDDNGSPSWILFDFIDRKISVKKYMLKFSYHSAGVQRWILSGSNDNNSWTEIDNRANETKQHSDFEEEQYISQNDSTQKFRYIKLEVVPYSYFAGYSQLALTSIEFYGECN